MDTSTTWIVCLTAFTTLVFLYRRFTQHFGYWESQGVPTEKTYPIIGTEWSMFTTPMNEVDVKRARKLGRIYGLYFLSCRILHVLDPEIIKLILVKDFNLFVNRQMTFLLKDVAKKHTQNALKLAEKGKSVNMKELFSKYTIEVIGSCVFGMKLDSFTNPNHPFIINSKKFFDGGIRVTFTFIANALLPQALSIIKNQLQKVIGFGYFNDAAKEMLEVRRSVPTKENVDFLQLLLDAKEKTLDNSEIDKDEITDKEAAIEKTQNTRWTKTLDEDEIVAQCATFLFVGHDSVASTLAHVAYNLARHSEEQDKLLQEIDDAWEKHGDIDYDVINKMPYLHAIISETLRIFPVAVRVFRQAKEDYQIPNTNIIIPKNALVQVPIYAVHHDQEFFSDPEKFDPDRFLPENKDNILPYTYLPFGDGPRNCIAMRFALINMKFCLAYFLRYIKFCPTEDTKKPLKFLVGGQVLQLKHGVIVRLEKRRNYDLT